LHGKIVREIPSISNDKVGSMNRPGIYWLSIAIIIMLILLYVYSDYAGNPKMQETVGQLLTAAVSAIVGALANEFARKS
jgi:hypothetical protein